MARKHVIAQGEGVSSVAVHAGFFPDTIWQHDQNAALREAREDADALLPGDDLFVPDLRVKSVDVQTGARHRFRRRGVPAIFEIQLFVGDTPRKNLPYRLVIDDSSERHGQTDDRGNLRTYVPPDAARGQLWIGDDEAPYVLRFGHLDPGSEVVGIQKRLRNMGYAVDDPDGDLGASTHAAVRAFQAKFRLPLSGDIDDATRAKIVATHDDVAEFPAG